MPFLRAGFNPRRRDTGIRAITIPSHDLSMRRAAPANLIRFACGDYCWDGYGFFAWGEQCRFARFFVLHEWPGQDDEIRASASSIENRAVYEVRILLARRPLAPPRQFRIRAMNPGELSEFRGSVWTHKYLPACHVDDREEVALRAFIPIRASD